MTDPSRPDRSGPPSSGADDQATVYDLAELIADRTPEEIYGPGSSGTDPEVPTRLEHAAWTDLPWRTPATGHPGGVPADLGGGQSGPYRHRATRPGPRARTGSTRSHRPRPAHVPWPVALVALGLALAVCVAVVVVLLRPDGVVGRPTAPTATVATPSPTAGPPTATPTVSSTPTPSPLPPFADCAQLGAGIYCAVEPECWNSIRSYADAPRLADRTRCDEPHLYQTFVVGLLEVVPRRHSDLDALPAVRRVCRAAVVNAMLEDRRDVRSDWEVYAVPPQSEDEPYFRCIFGRGERSSPYALARPR
jgi:hypothetical protein